MASMPYIGSRISLISKSEIRYEGTLDGIDPDEHTVSLSNVKSFGTEGRKGQGREILASNELYEAIIFRGSEIKDLTVIQSTAAPAEVPRAVEKPWRPRQRTREVYGELRENAKEEAKFSEDFDFGNSVLERQERKDDGNKAYDRNKGFFDHISSDAKDTDNRFDREKQKARDSETFGEYSVSEGERMLRNYRFRGNRRGRYRPNRNRYRRRY